jgi:2-amino-4-hydroxy-6-hydroxymethyldihydropteridine diphosphokinase
VTVSPFFLSLGSNIGDREEYLLHAVNKINTHPSINIRTLSSLYETEPVGMVEQSPFLNMVVKGETSLSEEELLYFLQQTETELDRTREIRWGPRTIDLDILLYNNIQVNTEHLVIPHSRMKERAFVLVPLAEIAPECIIPGENISIIDLIGKEQGKGVSKWRTRLKSGEKGFELSES